MRVVVNPPTTTDPSATEVTLSWSGVALWEKQTKEIAWNPGQTTAQIPVSQLQLSPLELWAEATSVSGAVRDLWLSVMYPIPLTIGSGVGDRVLATGVWASTITVEHDRKTAAELLGPGAPYSDMEDPPSSVVGVYGGTGLLPSGIDNGILFQFTISPSRNIATDGRWEDDKVFFDATRQIKGHIWEQTNPGVWVEDTDWRLYFPLRVEVSNDDPIVETDESDRVTDDGHFYSYDAPGEEDPLNDYQVYLAWRYNFKEWLRVGFGSRPVGENDSGSRVSSYYDWHVAHTFDSEPVFDQNGALVGYLWVRTTGDVTESKWVNSVGEGHMPSLGHP